MKLSDLNGFDWLLLSILLISMGIAYRRGIVRTIFGLVGLIGGLAVATQSYIKVADWIGTARLILSPSTARVVAFLMVAVLTAVLCELTGLGVQKFLRVAGLGFIDRLLGVAFGFVRGCVIGIGVLMVTTTFAPQSWVVTTSVLSPYLFGLAHDVSFLVPQYLQQRMAAGEFNYKQTPPDWINHH